MQALGTLFARSEKYTQAIPSSVENRMKKEMLTRISHAIMVTTVEMAVSE